jgi:hypothetical protein
MDLTLEIVLDVVALFPRQKFFVRVEDPDPFVRQDWILERVDRSREPLQRCEPTQFEEFSSRVDWPLNKRQYRAEHGDHSAEL